ncbi:thiamine phosphate synthase [Alkalitalea saponilacus]|uniref:Thiamine-phosphate pyrophosphorylase n=1 Tax=Alkalitalea saponilacus TaxID=889453 RepID=A0A1T5HSL4_9BACT|nr:thiamine phosphate synthase [Alkalitalea saponilacus]ASB49991.1 thiamine phosphate synthase [Alkalitalea saponilacus]SKC23501.1 thiamine-phosphate pyrophosphorylase [Alkalitalea saponilacus]
MLITITHPSILKNEAAAIAALLDNGACFVHIRKPGASDVDLLRFMQSIPEKYYPKLTMHYHFDVALKLGLGGLHRSIHFSPPQVDGVRLSAGCHSFEEVIEANNERWNYVFLSPVYISISKSGYNSGFTQAELNKFFYERSENELPVVALGGITKTNIKEVKSTGFAGAALLGSVWETDGNAISITRSVENFNRIYKAWNQ